MKAGRIVFAAMIVFAVVLSLLGGYFGAYLTLGEKYDLATCAMEGEPMQIARVYPAAWMTACFWPAARLESRCIGYMVSVSCEHPTISIPLSKIEP